MALGIQNDLDIALIFWVLTMAQFSQMTWVPQMACVPQMFWVFQMA